MLRFLSSWVDHKVEVVCDVCQCARCQVVRPAPLLLRPGTEKGMDETFGSTCHGAGRARSRNNSRNKLDYQQASGAREEVTAAYIATAVLAASMAVGCKGRSDQHLHSCPACLRRCWTR